MLPVDIKKLSGAVMVSVGVAITAVTGYHARVETVEIKAKELEAETRELAALPAYKFEVTGQSAEYLGAGQVSTKILLNKLTAALNNNGYKLVYKPDEEVELSDPSHKAQ